MKSRTTASLLLAAALLAPRSIAQETKPAPAPETKPAAPAPAPAPKLPGGFRNSLQQDDTLVTVDFPGGTVGQYIDALHKAVEPKPFNVFLDPDAAAFKAPPMKLSNASLLNSLRVLARSGTTTDGRYLNLAVENLESNVPGGAPTYVIRTNYMEGPSNPNASPRTAFVVLSLNPIVGLPGTKKDASSLLDAKAVLSAVESAVLVADNTSPEPPVLKFHEASGLLFVRGTFTQQKAAEDVINQLRKDVEKAVKASDDANANRTESKLVLHTERRAEVLESLRKHFESSCCIQFRMDGDTLIMTGDRPLVAEAIQWASAVARSLQEKDKNGAAK